MEKEKLYNNNKKIDKFLKNIIIVSGLIVFISSIEALITAKSKDLLDVFFKLNSDNTAEDFFNIVIINYFITILEPVLISLFSLFGLKKFGITSLYKIVFSIILIMRLFNIVISFRTNSIFYYLIIILYLLLIYLIISVPKLKRGD